MRRISFFCIVLFLGIVSVAMALDNDGDGIDDSVDNCSEIINSDQIDTDGDNLGNACDADLNNNCVVNFVDLAIMKEAMFTGEGDPDWNPHADLNGSGVVNFGDLGIMRSYFFQPPGPSSVYTACTACGATPHTVPMRWVEAPVSGEAIPGTSMTTTVCPGGTEMEVVTQALIPGDAYTLWYGFFQNPDACHFPPQTANWPDPEFKCGFFDVFNLAADGNFRYGDGKIVSGVDDHFYAFVASGAPHGGVPEDCAEDRLRCEGQQGNGINDDDAMVLTDPETAEYHAILLSHGPEDAEYMPAQVETHDGGCDVGDPGDPLDPNDDIPAERNYPCRTEQVSGVPFDGGSACAGDPDCIASLMATVGSPFVAGKAEGDFLQYNPATQQWDTNRIGVMIAARSLDDPNQATLAAGTCRLSHSTQSGELIARFDADVDCISVSAGTAFVLGTATRCEGQTSICGSFDPADNHRIVMSIADSAGADALTFDLPAMTGTSALTFGVCDPEVVDRSLFVVPLDEGDYYASE